VTFGSVDRRSTRRPPADARGPRQTRLGLSDAASPVGDPHERARDPDRRLLTAVGRLCPYHAEGALGRRVLPSRESSTRASSAPSTRGCRTNPASPDSVVRSSTRTGTGVTATTEQSEAVAAVPAPAEPRLDSAPTPVVCATASVQGERGGSAARALAASRMQASSCLVHTGVAVSLTASVTDTGARAPTWWPCPASFSPTARNTS
jgi:hypothetical protein